MFLATPASFYILCRHARRNKKNGYIADTIDAVMSVLYSAAFDATTTQNVSSLENRVSIHPFVSVIKHITTENGERTHYLFNNAVHEINAGFLPHMYVAKSSTP